ncbi:MAG: MFS transporter, partial [Tyzzerella sp.]|nr:MFS transporter [Tyzzerella sp.]
MSNSNEKQISMGVLLVLNLLIGFVISNINLGVAPILATIAGTYPDVAKSSIQGLMTTPSYLALAFGLLAGVLNTKFSVKKLLAVGISWFAVMGLVPLFVTDFTVLSICRILTGFSAGMVVPTSVTFIMSYYPKEKIATALGIQTAAVTGGQIIVNMLGGKLGAVQYNKFFMLYFVVAVAAVCIILLLPDRGPIKAKKAEG